MHELELTIPELLGFQKTKIIFYPFISGKGFQDIRKAFEQNKEADRELLDYYYKYIKPEMSLMERATVLAREVNKRIKYITDDTKYGRAEYWAKPVEVHREKQDDCDGYAVLLCKLLRLFGAMEWEVFVAAGWVRYSSGTRIGHAYVLVFDTRTMRYFPLEGSFQSRRALEDFGEVPLIDAKRYEDVWWITNDVVSYSKIPWLRFIR